MKTIEELLQIKRKGGYSMKHVELNLESKNILTDAEARIFMLRLYNSSILAIYKKPNPSANNGISYIVGYESVQSVDEIIRDIKFLCYTMEQNAIACAIDDVDLSIRMVISNESLQCIYRPFNAEYFIRCSDIFYHADMVQIYKREEK